MGMTETASDRPIRAADLEINPVNDGYVVYQPTHDRVHHLNQTAALVLELCNGRHAPDEMARLLQLAWQLPATPAEEVAACLAVLREEGLIR